MVFLRVDAPRLLEIEHGSDVDDDPARFHVTITFDEQSDGKCVLTMRQLHPTKENSATPASASARWNSVTRPSTSSRGIWAWDDR